MNVTSAQRLEELRALISNARAMPMSASCVINRGEVLAVIDAMAQHLPTEIDQAKQVIADSRQLISDGEAEAGRILAEAREHAVELASHSEVVRVAEEQAAKIRADAEHEAEALRAETDGFIDSRMASFESVLVKTTSQVQTARHRLAERSSLSPDTSAPNGVVGGTNGQSREELPNLA